MLDKIKIRNLLEKADVKINGKRSWDINLKNKDMLERIKSEGIIGLGDSYVEGDWDCDSLDEFFNRLIISESVGYFSSHQSELKRFNEEKSGNLQEGEFAKDNIRRHYDSVPEDIFRATLDEKMVYSCGYWTQGISNLDEAQEAKLDLVCRKIGLEKGMDVLDIGSGWGSFVKFAAENYGVNAVGITLSENQAEFSRKSTEDLPVEIRLQDYRELKDRETFDRVVSIGMFEHVGHKNYRTYMESVDNVLKNNGLFLLHCFGGRYATPNNMQPETRWVERYIFPGMDLPSVGQIATAANDLFDIQDIHNFGRFYDPTLMAWADNFNRSWKGLKEKLGNGKDKEFGEEKFSRFWNYYLKSCAGGFRSGKFHVWQTVFSKGLGKKVYQSER